MGETDEHPSYREEAAKLADVVRHIEDEGLRLLGQMPATAADQETANEIQRVLERNADSLYRALEQPYFGRLDYFVGDAGAPPTEAAGNGGRPPEKTAVDAELEDDEGGGAEPPKTIYLGIVYIPTQDVFSWTAPVGKLWYTQSYDDGYTAPRGHVPARVDLKRYVRIREQRLEGLTDIFRRALPAPAAAGRDALTEALSGAGGADGHLQVIVETIEPDQYEKIANVSDKVLIVQGAAGSGKSEIGLHRIAYLLSPFSDIAEHERPTPETTLFVGPSQAFLEYAADILPTLGVVEGVSRVRFSDWVSGVLSERTNVTPRIFRNLLDRGEMTLYDEAAETFKGSLVMADVLERRVREQAAAIRRRCLRLPREVAGLERPNRLSGDRIRAAVNAVLPSAGGARALNRGREEFIDRIARSLQAEDRPVQASLFSSETRRAADREERGRRQAATLRAVARWCDRAWKHIDFKRFYADILADSDGLTRLAGDGLPPGAAAELARSADRIDRQGFDDSDIGALAYLDHLLNDTIAGRYRHIVVDEAQDISPIEFKLLATASLNNWFTVLGDTAQRLTPYRGVKTWRDVERVFGRSEIEVQRARRSYRSTRQITEFNNRILRTYDKNIAAPIAYDRQGHRVEYNRHGNTDAMYQAIVDDLERVRSLEGLEDASVAVLARDMSNLKRFRRFCEQRGIGGVAFVDQGTHVQSPTVVARIPDSKGLEYDAVIVMGVNETFADTVFNKKLLYLATTRAKHYLGIHWSGKQSPILGAVSGRGVTWFRGRSSS